ncbi:MAG: alpha/beta hydrolase-fold protein [Eubacteriales bacterium]|nr:alpha/beta hydrolase-fold protein [Eubacteriales bacterium]MDD4324130.1 alpha/beta hydrolase-fold protein [Eubacteriales bacterium]MDD4541143.1 alpha/beta hydrolase-fold protein [Eubacteriales bacterium]
MLNPLELHQIKLPYDDKTRRIRVLLPQDYYTSTWESYPVLYMHDGQNLFFDEESFAGHSWRVSQTINSNPELPQIIIVGIDNSETNRLLEYTPWNWESEPGDESALTDGLGMQYGHWVVHTVKPFIDQQYRTKTEREHTLLAGSSLGGLISAYIGSAYANVFASLGILSLASIFVEENLLDYIQSHPLHPETKVYIQLGTEEGYMQDKEFSDIDVNQDYIDWSLHYYQALLLSGHPRDRISLNIYAGERHFEKYWADHFHEYLEFSLYN